jgi:hypothetical protein
MHVVVTSALGTQRAPAWCLLGRTLLWLALSMLVLGLPRLLVVCHGPHCHGQIEFVHVAGSCCGHAGPDHRDPVHRDTKAERRVGPTCGTQDHDGDDCEDVSLDVDENAPPKPVYLDFDAYALAPPPVFAVVPCAVHASATAPPATGPPRVGQGITLRQSTLLLL